MMINMTIEVGPMEDAQYAEIVAHGAEGQGVAALVAGGDHVAAQAFVRRPVDVVVPGVATVLALDQPAAGIPVLGVAHDVAQELLEQRLGGGIALRLVRRIERVAEAVGVGVEDADQMRHPPIRLQLADEVGEGVGHPGGMAVRPRQRRHAEVVAVGVIMAVDDGEEGPGGLGHAIPGLEGRPGQRGHRALRGFTLRRAAGGVK